MFWVDWRCHAFAATPPPPHTRRCGAQDPQEQRSAGGSRGSQREERVCGVEDLYAHGRGLQPNRGAVPLTPPASLANASDFETLPSAPLGRGKEARTIEKYMLPQ